MKLPAAPGQPEMWHTGTLAAPGPSPHPQYKHQAAVAGPPPDPWKSLIINWDADAPPSMPQCLSPWEVRVARAWGAAAGLPSPLSSFLTEPPSIEKFLSVICSQKLGFLAADEFARRSHPGSFHFAACVGLARRSSVCCLDLGNVAHLGWGSGLGLHVLPMLLA